ncbi:MAG TPA: TIGR03621 family F420-dependent LLM class oxidoreductase [Candidatus Limnocylindria bacterium]|nr:TIGR03621 family F420-dependent LLM class oxidoreductase [Candidatus Limnocylindria bacterium]
MHPKPFQFLADAGGVMNARALGELARRAEAAGFHGLVVSDHLVDKLAPVPVMAVVAAASERLRMSAFVFNNDFRQPAVLAQELASLDVLSDGRLDVGIGAGWRKVEYDGIGMAFDPVPVRSERLAEAITVLKGLFADEPFSFEGRHYRIHELDGLPKPVQRPHPPFMIGGGGRRTLSLAGREAQIVGLAPRIHAGGVGDPLSFTLEATAEKIGWVREAAGDRFDQLTFNVYPSMSQPSVTDHPATEIAELAERLSEMGGAPISPAQVSDSPHVMIGSVEGLTEKFVMLRDRLGISSILVGEVGPMDAVVERLAGT